MFNVLLESNRPRLAVGGSFVLSTMLHLAAAGVVVAVTHTPSLEPVRESFISRALYMPPPDRRPAASASAERLQYVAFGLPDGGLPIIDDLPVGRNEFGSRNVTDPEVGADNGDADRASIAAQDVPSQDTAFSVLEVDSTVQRFVDSDAPLYPPVLLAQLVEGAVYLRYVVDTLGRADPGSAEVLRSSHPQFTQAVLQALPGMRFRPAMIASRRVRQLVEQEFAFRIQSPAVAASLSGSVVPR